MKNALLFLLTLVVLGCDQSAEAPPQTNTTVETGDINTGTVSEFKTGIVSETIGVESYTYIRINQKDQDIWLASTPIEVSNGDQVRYSGDIQMNDFYSKSLERTFPVILFVNQIEVVSPDGMETATGPNTPVAASNPHAGMAIDPLAAQETIEVQALEGGKTIADIFAEHEQLEGQEVRMRARVTKFSPNILGKNWITLQDGTGIAPDDALVVTSLETLDVGAEVIVKGMVKSNVDIGAGYTYKVILEEASFNK